MKKVLLKVILIISILTVSFSCNGQSSKSELVLRDCINEKVNYNIQESTGKTNFDFFKFSLKAEKILLENGLIDNNGKEEYLEFLEGIDTLSSKEGFKAYKQLQQLTDSIGFNYGLFIIADGVLNQCPYNVYKSQQLTEDHLIYRQLKIVKELMDNGYYEKDLIRNLFEEMNQNDFKNVLYKGPVIYLILMNMDFQYGPQRVRKMDPSKLFGNE